MKTSRAYLSFLLLAMLGVAMPALATGPLAKCSSGTPYLWAAGGANIPFNPDQGNLGPLAHDQAVAATQDAFNVWGAVPTATVSYLKGAELPVNVDISNYAPWLDAAAPDGLSAIVFDDTGEIFDELFGPDSGVLGFAGPEWGDTATCTITEGLSFLNGPAFSDPTYAKDVMVHEFGHYTNLAHTIVNGQVLGFDDTSGPTPNNTFGLPADVTVIETMYPFYFGPGSGTQTLETDDVAGVSTLYPAPTFAATTGSIRGTIFASNGTTRLSGVNVIARNIANPFFDAVSAISGDYTDAVSQDDPVVGTYKLNGLTPGATYAVYVDQILEGGFSTEPITLPNKEEFYNVGESDNVSSPDDPTVFSPVASVAGTPTNNINVIFNSFAPGDPLPIGDDDFLELALPFSFSMCGQSFNSVFVNSNGSLTFGAGSTTFSESAPGLSSGPPRIAGLWDDLDPTSGGVITFQKTSRSFDVSWTNVPEYSSSGSGGSNTFAITLLKDDDHGKKNRDDGSHFKLSIGNLTALDGLTGYSCGGRVSAGFEDPTDLGKIARHEIDEGKPDVYEIFTPGHDNDLANKTLSFKVPGQFHDVFGNNNTIKKAVRIDPPFDTVRAFTEISPEGGDVDYYRFRANAGDILAIEVVRGSLDSVLGVFDADTGTLLAADDDGGGGFLSRLLLQVNANLNLAVAVSAYPDVTFTGAGEDFGRYVLSVRKYHGTVLAEGDDTSTEVPFTGFTFPYQGKKYSSVFVNSNGNLTFGAGDSEYIESVDDFLSGPPRIAPLWDDLNANTGAVIAEPLYKALAIHYVSVPEFGSDTPNYFSVLLDQSGAFALDYAATNRSDALVGITQGNGASDPGETDLSRWLPIFRKRGTTYEQFITPEPVDLSWQSLFFLLP